MIRNQGLYVLMGSKPMIDFSLDPRNITSLSPLNSWDEWEEKMKNIVGPCFRFTSMNLNNHRFGLFINVPNVVCILKMHYQEFATINKGPFDPDAVIDEIGQENSNFWNQVLQSSLGNGLLLGYGKRNALLFDYRPILPRFADMKNRITVLSKKEVRVSDLPLPSFCVFCLGDEIMEHYKRQRIEIIKAFSGKDFEAVVKQWLRIGCEKELEIREVFQ